MKLSKRFKAVLMLATAICIGVLAIGYIIFRLPEANIEQALKVYSNSRPIGQDQARYGADVAQKNIYYWTADPIQNVQNYYAGLFGDFLPGDAQTQWLISGFNIDRSPLTPATNSSFLTLPSFCKFSEPYRCATLSLVKADQAELYKLAIVSPKSFQNTASPTFIADLPKNGTLIIYSYYVRNF
jgi:hypothetical protein